MKPIKILILLLTLLIFNPQASFSEDQGINYARGLSEVFEKVADQITPSMVSISSVKKTKVTRSRGRQPLPDPLFEQFRDFFGEDFPDQGPGNEGPQQGLGTGVIIDSKGHILTNNHVVGDADEVTVKLFDKRSFKAEIVGRDPNTDLAVIKVKADNIVPATLGDSDKLKIGQWVIAAGNPFGLDNSITAGIVSAKGRSLMGGSQYEDFIQTDAAINPGNSGGPMVNLEGEVVGINSAIFSRSGGYMGIGFAIPINMARSILNSLIEKGKVVRGWLGVAIKNLTDDMAKSFDYTSSEGALVEDVEKNSPADKAGLLPGDIIVKVNDTFVKDVTQLRNVVAAISPGDTTVIEFIRDGRKKSANIVVGELGSNLPSNKEEELSEDEAISDLGMNVESMTAEIAKQLNTDRKNGVVVTEVRPNGIAAQAGLMKRDIITKIGNKEIKDLKDFKEVIKESDLTKGIRISVEKQGMHRFLFLKTTE